MVDKKTLIVGEEYQKSESFSFWSNLQSISKTNVDELLRYLDKRGVKLDYINEANDKISGMVLKNAELEILIKDNESDFIDLNLDKGDLVVLYNGICTIKYTGSFEEAEVVQQAREAIRNFYSPTRKIEEALKDRYNKAVKEVYGEKDF